MEDTQIQNIAKDSSLAEVTLRDGLLFVFTDGENEISAHGSAISGKETVRVNGDTVSEKRSLGVSSRHYFEVDGCQYEVAFYVTKLIRGGVECLLFKDNILIARDEKVYLKWGSYTMIGIVTVLFLAGVAAGIFVANLIIN